MYKGKSDKCVSVMGVTGKCLKVSPAGVVGLTVQRSQLMQCSKEEFKREVLCRFECSSVTCTQCAYMCV